MSVQYSENVVFVQGELVRPFERRVTATGEDSASFDLRVRYDDQPSETVPVVWDDLPAKIPELLPDDGVVVIGRVRRRFFRSAGSTQSRTEVVAAHVIPARQRKRIERLRRDLSNLLADV